ncbi:MAG: HNH/ENDO VII family nuclease [Dethiosulfatibacter sp.]|nr:HNH/ENDO VII family nuclease [Dethiosulfatibacter sp.]
MTLKRITAIFLACLLIVTGCNKEEVGTTEKITESQSLELETTDKVQNETTAELFVESNNTEIEDYSPVVPEFSGMDDVDLLRYVQDNVYSELVKTFNSDEYYVENVEAVYISKEYLEEVAFNSQSNIFFGYTLDELNEQFEGTQYAFGLGNDGTTIVYDIEEYDDTYERIIKDVAIGSGVILICVTVSVVAGGVGAPAVSMVFVASAKTGTIIALSSGALSGVAAGVVTGMKTRDFDQAVKAGAAAGADGFKWGAISGALLGGATETIALKGATLNGLSMNEAALIQKETGYPLDVIKGLKNIEQYKILKQAGLKTKLISGKSALVRDGINLNYVDEFGRTNLERMKKGLAALDANGIPYELHHIGQKTDSTLAVLTQAEHRLGNNHKIWHDLSKASEIDHASFDKIRQAFWKDYLELIVQGGI